MHLSATEHCIAPHQHSLSASDRSLADISAADRLPRNCLGGAACGGVAVWAGHKTGCERCTRNTARHGVSPTTLGSGEVESQHAGQRPRRNLKRHALPCTSHAMGMLGHPLPHPGAPILMLCKHVYGADAIALSWHSGRLLPIVLPPCGTETRCTSPQPSIAPHHTSILYRPAIDRWPIYRQPTDCPGIVSGVRRAAASPCGLAIRPVASGARGTPPDTVFPPPRWVQAKWKAN